MMIRVSEILENELHPLIHGALISRIIVSKKGDYFAAVSAYQKSSKVKVEEFDFESYTENYVTALNNITENTNWITYDEYKRTYNHCGFSFAGKEKAVFLIINDLNITKSSFFNRLYFKLFNNCPWFIEEEFNESKKHFIRGFCELRGSIDTTRPLIAMDYFYDNTFELGKSRLLNEYLMVPYYLININFRELQDQYVKGINRRNTQLRLQLNWYVKNIGLINEYKVKIVDNVYSHNGIEKKEFINYIDMTDVIPEGSELFLNRLNHFSNKIFGKNLEEKDVNRLRKELGFDDDKYLLHLAVPTYTRSKTIVELVRIYTDDECGACKFIYNLDDRTFIHRRTERPYFEIHHNISLNNTAELDHEDNLVKLCPACHTALKAGVGCEDYQKELIDRILSNNPNVLSFAEHYFDSTNRGQIIENIYLHLK
ncbi:MAG: HNH endonuclease [Bacilli bacterium]